MTGVNFVTNEGLQVEVKCPLLSARGKQSTFFPFHGL